MKRSLAVLSLLLMAGCSTRTGDAMSVTVNVDPSAKSTHVVLTVKAGATELKTKCLAVPTDRFLDIAVLRRDLPSDLELVANGFTDSACTQATSPVERAGPLTRSFEEGKIATAFLVLKPDGAMRETNCSDGLDDDGDGDIDCKDVECDAQTCVSDNRCVQGQSCREGACQGGTQVVCDSPPTCFAPGSGVCVVSMGCQYTPTSGTSCDDGDPCTSMDKCTIAGACLGTSACTSPPPGVCVKAIGTCSGSGVCTYDVDVDAMCDDGNPCTQNDRCAANGTCAGTGAVCAPAECQINAGCLADGGCQFANVDAGTACSNGGACNASGGCLPPFDFFPSNVNLADVPTPSSGKVVFNCGTTIINTGTAGAPTIMDACPMQPPLAHASITQGGVPTLVLAFSDLEITGGATLRIIGARPVIIVSMKDIAVLGDIVVTAGAQTCAASGAGQNGGGGTLGWQSGGGGGGFGSVGARGGDVSEAPDGLGGGINGGAALRGGCPGGRGGNNPNASAPGGGALQLVARERLSLSGTINAPGSGGKGGGG
ncbi:MAG: hypothetical protein ACO1OB_34230, partial [Archangium sp.]